MAPSSVAEHSPTSYTGPVNRNLPICYVSVTFLVFFNLRFLCMIPANYYHISLDEISLCHMYHAEVVGSLFHVSCLQRKQERTVQGTFTPVWRVCVPKRLSTGNEPLDLRLRKFPEIYVKKETFLASQADSITLHHCHNPRRQTLHVSRGFVLAETFK